VPLLTIIKLSPKVNLSIVIAAPPELSLSTVTPALIVNVISEYPG
jgi:hypothetical protein